MKEGKEKEQSKEHLDNKIIIISQKEFTTSKTKT
jgi:hypothetical protein